MFKKFTPVFVLLLALGTVQAQTKKSKPEEAALAKELEKKFPNDNSAYVSSEYRISFELDTKNQLVEVHKKVNNVVTSIKGATGFTDYVYYNDQCEIKHYYGAGGYRRGVTSEDIFVTDEQVMVFGLAFKADGSKEEYKYEEVYKDARYFCQVFFQETSPIQEKRVIFEIPDWLDIEFKEYNFQDFNIKKEESTKGTTRIVTYTGRDLASFGTGKQNVNAPPLASTYPHLLIIPKKAASKKANFQIFESTADLYKFYMGICKDIGNKPEELKSIATTLTANKKTDEEKIKTIFYWVQDQVRYIAFENGIMGFRPEPAQTVYKNRFGDCKGMANLLAEMLKNLGYDARLTWIGTKGIPYDYSVPSLAVDNHMICTVFLKGEKIYLDGTEDYIGFKDYAHRIQGRPVMIQNGENFELSKVPEFGADRNVESEKTTMNILGTNLEAESHLVYNGEGKTDILRGISEVKSNKRSEAIENFLRRDNNNISFSSVTTSDVEERDAPLKLDYKMNVANQITGLDNEMYVEMILNHDLQGLVIDSTRFSPFDFGYKLNRTAEVTLNVPKGYKVGSTPKSVVINNEDFKISLAYEALAPGKLIYRKTITVPKAMIQRKNIKAWNQAVKEMKAFYAEPITLQK